MKPLFIFFGLIVSISLCHAQEKISGLGPFKINEVTTKVIDEVAKEKKAKLRVTTSIDELNSISEKMSDPFWDIDKLRKQRCEILELKCDTNTKSEYMGIRESRLCADARVFYISCYFLGDIYMKNTFLTFYKDTLVEVRCRGNQYLLDAVKAKYGQPERRDSTGDVVTCSYQYTDANSHPKYYKHSYWYNNNIVSEEYSSKIYASGCEAIYDWSFSIKDKNKIAAIDAVDKDVLARREARRLASLKGKL